MKTKQLQLPPRASPKGHGFTPEGTASRDGRPQPKILVGTASWSDPGFVKDWYPKGLRAAERLPWYAEHFDLVEVNSSFYSVPSAQQTEKWCDQTPSGFVFNVKLHRLLSRHSTEVKFLPRGIRSLAGTGNKVKVTSKLETALIRILLEAIEPLVEAHKFGAFLLQLTPSFGPKRHSLDELDHLIELLDGYKVAIELRNGGLAEGKQLDQTAAWFRKHRVAYVTVDGPEAEHFMVMPNVDLVTTRSSPICARMAATRVVIFAAAQFRNASTTIIPMKSCRKSPSACWPSPKPRSRRT